VNRLILIGRAGKDPETRTTPGGMTVCNFSLATSYKSKGNEQTDWHRVVLFDRLAEVASKYVSKGDQVCVTGRVTERKWTDKDGNERRTTEVIGNGLELLGSKPRTDEPRRESPAEEPFKDDIPF
jgi:single-strand DNA-binding protein